MIHKLKYPFSFHGTAVTELILPDYMKPKYRLVIARMGKLARECGASNLHEDGKKKLEELTDEEVLALSEFEVKSTTLMLETYCENLPPGAAEEVSDDDAKFVSEHVERMISKDGSRYQYSESHPKKKRTRTMQSGK